MSIPFVMKRFLARSVLIPSTTHQVSVTVTTKVVPRGLRTFSAPHKHHAPLTQTSRYRHSVTLVTVITAICTLSTLISVALCARPMVIYLRRRPTLSDTCNFSSPSYQVASLVLTTGDHADLSEKWPEIATGAPVCVRVRVRVLPGPSASGVGARRISTPGCPNAVTGGGAAIVDHER